MFVEPDVVFPSRSALCSRDKKSSEAAYAKLKQLGEPVVPVLVEALKTGTLVFKYGALVALGGLGVLARSAVPVLIEFIKKGTPKDPKEDPLRGVCATVLGEIGDLEAVPCLIEAL